MRSFNPDSFRNLENFIIIITSFMVAFYELLVVSRKMGIDSRRSVKLAPLVLLIILIISPPFLLSVIHFNQSFVPINRLFDFNI